MCGIVAVVRKRTSRPSPSADELIRLLGEIELSSAIDIGTVATLSASVKALQELDTQLRGEAGARTMISSPSLISTILGKVKAFGTFIEDVEAQMEQNGSLDVDTEALNALLVSLKDIIWALENDRVRTATQVANLAGPEASDAALTSFLSIQQVLSNIDRLEVRGRDSAGISILVTGFDLDVDSDEFRSLLELRSADPLFGSGSVRLVSGNLNFVYKAAAEIGELGDNTKAIREQIKQDSFLHKVLNGADSQTTVLAHTRWASVGIISEPNAHPVNSEEVSDAQGPFVNAVLNGDVDNFADLKAAESLAIAGEITTDAKVIPTMVSRNLAKGLELDEAFRSSVCQFEGSVAIGVSSAADPRSLHLALRGSGQGVYVGLAEDAFIVASEPYGVVEDADFYLRMDGETALDPSNPMSQGQIICLSGQAAGEKGGVKRLSYDGSPLPVEDGEWKTPSVTTRDIDRGQFPHFLLKEISESPMSFRKTLRGRLVEGPSGLTVELPAETLSDEVKQFLSSGQLKRVEVIGQGTAAVAGQAIADFVKAVLGPAGVAARPITATELSGFEMRDDMSDTLIIAVSQSGTTTDTNRTVDVVRARGAKVLAIVNRRGSDLVDKSDGVLYTSDGRDVEMSVASTKAFYAQIAAGFLLADGLSQLVPGADTSERQDLLQSLRDLPTAMTQTLSLRSEISKAASAHAPLRRYWAIVGNGANKVAAEEIRIKLSELCYKAIACDVTEDKKHIDLSSEPLILVCAAGLVGSNADDVAKEVAIFKAHKAAPIVIASEGENRFSAALEVIQVPHTHGRLAFVLSTMVGHLFGYEAALAIDASARPLREIRGAIENYVGSEGDLWFEQFSKDIKPLTATFLDALRSGAYNGHLEASTATKVAALLRFASSSLPLESYQDEFGKVGTPGVVVEDLALALTSAIEELTRPVDAIKHQAKTVTVGISRADETLLQSGLTRAVLESGCPRDSLTYASLRTLASVAPAVEAMVGYTRYRLDGDANVDGHIYVVDKGGLAADLTSRVEKDPTLRGTKRRVAVERIPFVTVGTDNRIVLLVPEVKDNETVGITLGHIVLKDKLNVSTARAVLQGYRNRYRQLVDLVTESHPTFREDILADVSTVELLTAPISDLAHYWTAD